MIYVRPDQLQSDFDLHAFKCKHDLLQNPLLRIENIRNLASSLPSRSYEFQSGQAPLALPDISRTPKTGLDFLATIDSLDEVSSWVVLKNIEQDKAYADFLKQELNSVQKTWQPDLEPIQQLEGFIFLSSRQAITPYHMDPEHNFLL